MQVILDEKELKKAVEFYLLQNHGLTVQSEFIKFANKQDKAVSLNGVVVNVQEKEKSCDLEI